MSELTFPEPPLTDETVLLRPWREADIPAVLAAMSDPLFVRFTEVPEEPLTVTEAQGYLAELEQLRMRGEALNFAFADPPDTDTVLGGGSLYDVSTTMRRAAVGYWLMPEARGRGVTTHAVTLMARWAFSGVGIARLQLTCSPDNAASQRVAERCGFVREGVLRAHLPFKGARRDSVIYSLLPSDLGPNLSTD